MIICLFKEVLLQPYLFSHYISNYYTFYTYVLFGEAEKEETDFVKNRWM